MSSSPWRVVSRGSASAVGGEESPCVSLADAQDLGGLHERQISGDHLVEYVASCLFELLHCHPLLGGWGLAESLSR